MIRVGVLGAGSHSRGNHGPALNTIRDEAPNEICLAGVCDLNEERRERYADEFGFEETYESLDGMLESADVDGVVAVTPVEKTRELVGRLLSTGLPTLLEKPPGTSVDEARELRAIADEMNCPHMVSMNRRFNPAVQQVRRRLADLWLDPPVEVTARMYRERRTESGFLKDTGIHAADLVCSFLGSPRDIHLHRWRSTDRGEPGSHHCAAVVRFDDAIGNFTIASSVGCRQERYEVLGESYRASIDVRECSYRFHVEGQETEAWDLDESAPGFRRNGTLAETRAFLDAVADEGPYAPTLTDVVPSMALAQRMNEGTPGRLDEQ